MDAAIKIPFYTEDVEWLKYTLDKLKETFDNDGYDFEEDKQQAIIQYGRLTYLLIDLLGVDAPCSFVDPVLDEKYQEWCEHPSNKHIKYDSSLSRRDVLIKIRNFN